jgi:hypothetical protein
MVKGLSTPMDGSSSLEPLVTVDEACLLPGGAGRIVYLWAETDRIPLSKIGALRSVRRSVSSANGVPIGNSLRPGSMAWTADRNGLTSHSWSCTSSSPATTARSSCA